MKCNKNKIKQNCGNIVYGVCTRYEGTVSDNSSLIVGCLNLDETTQDIYDQLDAIDGQLNMASLENDCITFTEPRTPASVINQLYQKLCSLEDTVASQAQQILTLQGQVEELQQQNCP